jgi:hypothetical protein
MAPGEESRLAILRQTAQSKFIEPLTTHGYGRMIDHRQSFRSKR